MGWGYVSNMIDLTHFDSTLVDILARAKESVVQLRQHERGIGTGVIWSTHSESSLILTNHHVVAGHPDAGGMGNAKQQPIRVSLHDGRETDAVVVARNPDLDLALLQIPLGALPVAPVADSRRLRVGEWVFAIGNPWGARDVVTHGIVNGIGKVGLGVRDSNRAQENHRVTEYVRSDVALAPGNSGGPLLNARGEVIGINAMIMGGDLSVAIPSHVAVAWLGAWTGEQTVKI